jgi:hypothetical protein
MPKRALRETGGSIVGRLVPIITRAAMGASTPAASATVKHATVALRADLVKGQSASALNSDVDLLENCEGVVYLDSSSAPSLDNGLRLSSEVAAIKRHTSRLALIGIRA